MKASKCLHKECVGILVIKIIVLDFSGCTFKIHKIRCVCTYKITVEIGGDTTGLSKALAGVNNGIKSTQAQLKDVNSLLKLDPSNAELLSPKQRLLSQAVEETIESTLTNEKYRGSAKLQKRFTIDFLTKTMKVNEGEIPQYWVDHSHEPIIYPDEWDTVQKEFARRKALGRSYSGNNVFASRIICGDCGGFYGPKVWNSTNKYRRTIWQCNTKFKGEHKCTTPQLDEEIIKARFLVAFSTLLDSKEAILEDCELVRAKYTDCSAIGAELANLLREIDVVTELTRKCVEENAASAQNQSEYTTRYNGYVEQYSATKARVEALEQKRTLRLERVDAFDVFIRTVRDVDTIPAEFDDRLWQKTIDNVTVKSNRALVLKFQNGMEIKREMYSNCMRTS